MVKYQLELTVQKSYHGETKQHNTNPQNQNEVRLCIFIREVISQIYNVFVWNI